jgi:uncharacterized protein YecE (DUF72 family)
LQTPASYQAWYQATPPDFMFTVKAPRYVTHILRLRGEKCATAIANFLASGIFNLREKLGADPVAVSTEFSLRCRTVRSFPAFAADRYRSRRRHVAKKHDKHVRHTCVTIDKNVRCDMRLKFAIPAFVMKRSFRCCANTMLHWSFPTRQHAGLIWKMSRRSFIYMRLHGSETLYGGEYADAALDRWAQRIRTWSSGKRTARCTTHRGRKSAERKKATRRILLFRQ